MGHIVYPIVSSAAQRSTEESVEMLLRIFMDLMPPPNLHC